MTASKPNLTRRHNLEEMKITVLDNACIFRDGKFHYGHLIIAGKYIEKVGSGSFENDSGSSEEMEYHDLNGKMILPGFANTHTHSPMVVFRGLEDFAPLSKWLRKVLEREAKLNSDSVYWFTLLAQMEMASKGITAFGDMYFHLDSMAKAVNEFGMKALLTRGLVDMDGNGRNRLMENLRELSLSGDRVRIGLGPHAPYTCSKEYLEEISNIAKSEGVKVMIHLLESPEEREDYTLRDLVETGIFETDLIGVHLVQVDEDDLRILKDYDVGIALCPVSNAKLWNGFPPVDRMMNMGLKLSVGTDGAASNNSLDVWKEFNYMALVARIVNEKFDVYALFSESFENGARILGFEDTGKIEEGYRADLTIVDSGKVSYFPNVPDRLISHILFSGNSGDVFATMVDGVWIYYDGNFPTVDENEIKRNALKEFERLEGWV